MILLDFLNTMIYKKKVSLIMLAFLLLPIFLFSQETEQTEAKKEWGKHQIKFTPTRMINLYYPGLEFGYEYRYNRFCPILLVLVGMIQV